MPANLSEPAEPSAGQLVSGPELLLDLGGAHSRVAVESALRAAVLDGRLGPGRRVPSSRALAAQLGVARGTVAAAYGQLVAEGWLESRRGSGTRVADRGARLGAEPARPAQPSAPPGPRTAVVDLRPGVPDLSTFPRAAWSRASERALRTAVRTELGYPDPLGHLALREELVAYLARARGVRTSVDRVVVCSGFVQVLDLLSRALAARGARSVAVEECSLPLHRRILTGAGLTLTPLPVDGLGARTDDLAGQDAVLLTPAHQFPLGVALGPARRTAVLDWARRRGAVVLEDDYDGELRYDRAPVGALQGLDPDLVAYAGTASKALAPAVGLAWAALPPALVGPVSELKERTAGTGVLEQLSMAELLRSGVYERHVRSVRLGYRRRRDQLVSALGERCPGVEVRGLAAGLHAVVTVDGRTAADEPALVALARRRGLVLAGLDEHRLVPEPEAPAALVVGYSRPAGQDWRTALGLLTDLLGESGPRDQPAYGPSVRSTSD
ncbi:MAG TPA: PLP-dependent aminotransferase family protein [Friedmanniella sp.]